MVNRRRVKNLAIKLVHLFKLKDIRYFPGLECWAEREIKGQDEIWRTIRYSDMIDITTHFLIGLNRSLPESDLVKEILIQIEQWMIASDGELVFLEGGKSQQWYPLCLIKSENNTTLFQVGDCTTT